MILNSQITVEQLNRYIYPLFNITEIYSTDSNYSKRKYRDIFKAKLFHKFTKNRSLRKAFRITLRSYDNIELINNNVNYDSDNDLANKVFELFDIDIDVTCDLVDIDLVFKNNKDKLVSKNTEIINSQFLEAFISQNEDVNSLLYFVDELEDLYDRYMEWININFHSGGGKIEPNTKRINFGNNPINFSNYLELKDELDKLLDR